MKRQILAKSVFEFCGACLRLCVWNAVDPYLGVTVVQNALKYGGNDIYRTGFARSVGSSQLREVQAV
jgi:hypothetical protein